MGRSLLFAGAALLLATAVIHALGQPMVDGWIQGLSEQQKAAICLVWITDSMSWAVVAGIWSIAGWRQQRGWLGASAVAGLIPATTAMGILSFGPSFFGGWMLVGSVVIAGMGLLLLNGTAD